MDSTPFVHAVCAISSIFAIYLKFGEWVPFLCNVIGAAFPIYASLKFLQSADAESNARWLCWCILFLDVIIRSWSLHWLVKCHILILFYLQRINDDARKQKVCVFNRVWEHLNGLETAAKSILKQAVEMDNSWRYLEALTCYREGLGLLMEIVTSTTDDARKQKFHVRMEEYTCRAEKLKILIEREKRAGQSDKHIHIPADGTGFSYGYLFKQYLDDELFYFLHFCELVCQNATSLKSITLTTGQEETNEGKEQQQAAFETMTTSLSSRSISLIIHYSATLHDREIRFNNGWIIKIGRGLAYFKRVPRYSLGYCDLNLRPCHETTVDIFHRETSGIITRL